jgi:hypothetical protein
MSAENVAAEGLTSIAIWGDQMAERTYCIEMLGQMNKNDEWKGGFRSEQFAWWESRQSSLS